MYSCASKSYSNRLINCLTFSVDSQLGFQKSGISRSRAKLYKRKLCFKLQACLIRIIINLMGELIGIHFVERVQKCMLWQFVK